MSKKETTQETTGLFTETLEDRIRQAREWMQKTSPSTQELEGQGLTNGETLTCQVAGVILFLAMLATHFKEYGWAVAAVVIVWNLMRPIIMKLIEKEGGKQ